MSINRKGTMESAQISQMGVINVSTANFKSEMPFCIKNDSDDSVKLEVCLWDMEPGTFVETTFDPGWNPEIVREVKQNNSPLDIKWGL